MSGNVIALKGLREPPRGTAKSKMDTMIITPDAVTRWKLPACQRGLKINTKVRAYVEESSSWRKDVGTGDRQPYALGILTGIGVRCDVIGVTPYLSGPNGKSSLHRGVERGYEIQAWLDGHPDRRGSLVILDDDSDMAHLAHRLVQTDWSTGLLDEHVERAAQMLMETE